MKVVRSMASDPWRSPGLAMVLSLAALAILIDAAVDQQSPPQVAFLEYVTKQGQKAGRADADLVANQEAEGQPGPKPRSDVVRGSPFVDDQEHAPQSSAVPVAKKSKPDLVVAKDGSGNFRTVQAAINAAPVGRTKRFTIFIKAGKYREKVTIPSNKEYLTLRGAGPYQTIIRWGDTASTKDKHGQPIGTFLSASVAVNADHFSAEELTFQNTAPRPRRGSFTEQAVAFRISGEFAAFYNVRFYGYQDTLYCHQGRHLFKNVYVRGSVDFIFGNGTDMFLDSLLYADVDSQGGGITAQKRGTPKETTGFVFLRCRVEGTGQVYLGRAWGVASRTVFAYTYMANVVLPIGWNDWNDPTRQGTIFYGEYKCSGPGSRRGMRAKWSFALTEPQARPFLSTSFIDGKSWLNTTGLNGINKYGTTQNRKVPKNSAIPRSTLLP